MDRRSFIRGGVLATGGIVVVGLSGLGSLGDSLDSLALRLGAVPGGTPPASIGAPEIAEIRRLAEFYETEAMRFGGDGPAGSTLYADGLTAAKVAHSALSVHCPAHVLPELQTAVAWLFRAVGFQAFDSGRRTIAEDLLWAAHELAGESGNVSLEARIVGTRARQDAWEGDPLKAAALTSRMLERAKKLTPTEAAMLHGVHARALARMGRSQAVFRAVGETDEAFAASQRSNGVEHPWVKFYDYPHQQGDTGRALLDLGVQLANPRRYEVLTNAETRSRQSIATYDVGTNRRSAAFTIANQATVQLALGHPEDALHLGRQAIGMQTGLTSRRMSAHLSMIRKACGDFCGGNSDAADLSESIGQTLAESAA